MHSLRAGARLTAVSLSLGVLAGCALVEALPGEGSRPDAQSVEQGKTPVPDGWVPPQPYPGDTAKLATVPLPGAKPGLASNTKSQAVDSERNAAEKSAALSVVDPLPVVKLEDLVGRDEKGVLALLGPPDAKWEKPPARVWRYLGDECILAAAFYLDVNDQTFRALSVAAEKIGGGNYAADRCLARIVEKQSARK